MVEAILFWVVAVASVLAALGVVLHRSIVYSALFLIVVFMSIAAVFVLNNADFLAVAQTLVYGVGLTIVLLFGVMFTGDRVSRSIPKSTLTACVVVAALFLGVVLAGISAPGFLVREPSVTMITTLQDQGTTGLLGELLFSRYVLPFELVSILLLAGMIGAIVVAKKSFKAETEAPGCFDINPESRLSEEAYREWEAFERKAEPAQHLAHEQAVMQPPETASVGAKNNEEQG